MKIKLGIKTSGELERYCRANRGKEWICIFLHPSWYIYSRNALLKNRGNKWIYETRCGSWANMDTEWTKLTGVKNTYIHQEE